MLQGRIHGRVDWETRQAYNIYAWLPGMDDAMPAGTRESEQAWNEQTIVVQAYYDAISVVPGRAPGAENAAP